MLLKFEIGGKVEDPGAIVAGICCRWISGMSSISALVKLVEEPDLMNQQEEGPPDVYYISKGRKPSADIGLDL